MAKIKTAEILDHLRPQLKQALGDALGKIKPDTGIDVQELYKEFRQAASRRCRPWEIVPNNYVDSD